MLKSLGNIETGLDSELNGKINGIAQLHEEEFV
jgi:hypothetical protein